ncbi:MAG: hypothetical protein ABIR66_07690 [Saprospiraceae bacterium]
MTRKAIVKRVLVLLFAFLAFIMITPQIITPFFKRKLEGLFKEKLKGYNVEFSQLEISIIKNNIALNKVRFNPVSYDEKHKAMQGEIETIFFHGIDWFKALFKKEMFIRDIRILHPILLFPFPIDTNPVVPVLAGFNLHINTLAVDDFQLQLRDSLSKNLLMIEDGRIKIDEFEISKEDTLSVGLIKKMQFTIKSIQKTSRDSLYTYTIKGMNYSNALKQLTIDTMRLVPNYTESAFANKHVYEVDRFHSNATNIRLSDFAFEKYMLTNNLVCSYLELGQLDLKIFRDNRKPDSHKKKHLLQDLIRSYPGILHIDSLKVLDGDIIYKEHAENAVEAGSLSFNKLSSTIYKISNDTINLNSSSSMDLYFDALLMGKGRIHLYLKTKIWDPAYTIAFGGHVSGFDMMALNPILGKNAFIYITSGKIESVNFSFEADKVRARGQMLLKYHDLQVAVKNKQNDDTVGLKSKLMTFIANKKILDSNPLPGENVRIGVIDYERDPEKFVLNYCFKAAFSGIKSTMLKTLPKKQNIFKKIFQERKEN